MSDAFCPEMDKKRKKITLSWAIRKGVPKEVDLKWALKGMIIIMITSIY